MEEQKDIKIIDLINASAPLNHLLQLKYTSFATVMSLSKLKRQLVDILTVYADEEKKLIDDYNNKIIEEIVLKDNLIKLQNEIVQEDIIPVELSENSFADCNSLPTPEDVFLLEPIIKWV